MRFNKISAKAVWRAAFAVALSFGVTGAAHSADAGGPRPASALDPTMLAACDARALPFGAYDPAVQSAVDNLDQLGVFSANEFAGANIGFCDLRDYGGPVATTSCDGDTILLDRKYRDGGNRLVLMSTLAHEMKHYLQHTEQKTQHGDGYCSSARYLSDKAWMEDEAAAFGDAIAALAFAGRPIEIENKCAETVDVYMDGEAVRFEDSNGAKLNSVPARTTISTNAATTTKFVQYFAASGVGGAVPRYWRGNGEERIINGARERLARAELTPRGRSSGPFVLTVQCD